MFETVEISYRQTAKGHRFDVTAISPNDVRYPIETYRSYEQAILVAEGFGGDFGPVIDLVPSDAPKRGRLRPSVRANGWKLLTSQAAELSRADT